MLFYLALTFGLEDDPPAAVERMVGFVEEVGHRHGVEHPIQMTIGTTDGKNVWAFRYSSEGNSRTLYYSTEVRTIRELYPGAHAAAGDLGRDAAHRLRAARRPPRGVERGAGVELRRHQEGEDEMHPFRPRRR